MTGSPKDPSSGLKTYPTTYALAEAASVLSATGVASPRVDAELLAAFVLDVPRGRLALVDGLTPAQRARFDQLVSARARRIPLQHLTGSAPFRNIDLAVGPGVFVPRPETELLAGWGVDVATNDKAPIVVDLCSGSGAIAFAVANEVPRAQVYAVERATAALTWLYRNAEARARAGDPWVTVVAGDAADPAVLGELDGRVDVVLCNPPYVPAGTPVPPEVADHDPADAVFAGADGLAVIRPVVARAAALLRPGGRFGIEHDESQASTVVDVFAYDGVFTEITGERDLAGRDRYTTARRNLGAATR